MHGVLLVGFFSQYNTFIVTVVKIMMVTTDKYNLLNLEYFKNVKFACSIYKVLHGTTPPPLN